MICWCNVYEIQIMRPKETGQLGIKAAKAIVRQMHFGDAHAARQDLSPQNDTLSQEWLGSFGILGKIAGRSATELHHMRLV